MSAIAAVNPITIQSSSAADAVAPAATSASQPQTSSGSTTQPAVIVSLSSNAAESAAAQASTSLASKVEDALYQISGANGFADIAAHFDYAAVAAKFGTTIANQDKATVDGGAALSASSAFSSASDLGIPITDSVSPDAAKSGAALGTISVGAFSFTSDGSSYSVTPGKDGTLVGTKDGQAWLTLQLTDSSNSTATDSGASAALATLNAITGQTSSSSQPAGIDLSA